jgi:8-oxo-dGTP pyrophosphatase MutT (NUDIX family)
MDIICNNCGVKGHLIQKCNVPITSYGVIVYDINKKKYLMICRSKSFGYIDFLHGNYGLNNIDQLQTLVDEMSIKEKENILNYEFDCLFNDLWNSKTTNEKSKNKFNLLKNGLIINNNHVSLEKIVEDSTTHWETPEWEFPKGRKNYHEKAIDCAIREFTEETGYLKSDIKIIENVLPFEEVFIGSNLKVYKHKYYLAIITGNINPTNMFQYSEISNISWKTYEECLESIRHYNVEKIQMFKNINKLITNYDIVL